MSEKETSVSNYVENIEQKASFLETKGFSIVEIGEYIIKYSNKDNSSIVIYCGIDFFK